MHYAQTIFTNRTFFNILHIYIHIKHSSKLYITCIHLGCDFIGVKHLNLAEPTTIWRDIQQESWRTALQQHFTPSELFRAVWWVYNGGLGRSTGSFGSKHILFQTAWWRLSMRSRDGARCCSFVEVWAVDIACLCRQYFANGTVVLLWIDWMHFKKHKN